MKNLKVVVLVDISEPVLVYYSLCGCISIWYCVMFCLVLNHNDFSFFRGININLGIVYKL